MISVIIPLYNKESSIARCINSVKMQSLSDWELIIVDDGSTDGSSVIVETYLSDERIMYLPKSNGGVSSARNYGIRYAKGEWIIYIDADDYFLPNSLEILLGLARKYNVDIATGNFFTELNGERHTALWGKHERLVKDNFRSWFFHNTLPRAGAALFKAELLKKHEFDESLCRYEDAKSLFDILRVNKMVYTPSYVMVYSKDNLELSKKAKYFSNDFISCMDFREKPFWEKVLLGNLISQGFILYADCSVQIKERYKGSMKWRYYAFILNYVYRFYSLFRKAVCS